MRSTVPIGGFFGLDLPDGAGGLHALWNTTSQSWAFANATSAFAALIEAVSPAAVWLPAFLCEEMASVVPADRLRFYGIGADLSPDMETLGRCIAAKDLVLAVNYFGKAPGPGWHRFVKEHPEAFFVEDCAQTVDTGEPVWGDWRLFSPRKLAGIPDGGILLPCAQKAKAYAPPPIARPYLSKLLVDLAPALGRMELPCDNDIWHPLNQAKERAHACTQDGMSQLSWRLMGLVDTGAMIDRRRANFAVLASQLDRWAVLPEAAPGYVPFGFPVRVSAERRDRICEAFYRENIFPAVHWRHLAVPADEFPDDWERARRFVTLPCDQRWSQDDMAMIAELFLQVVQ